MLKAAIGGFLAGILITGVILFARSMLRKKPDDSITVCTYSGSDPLNAGITRASRSRR